MSGLFGLYTRILTHLNRSRSNQILTNSRDKQWKLQHAWNIRCNDYSRDTKDDKTPTINDTAAKVKKKKVFIPRVTLLTENDEMSIVTLEMASKIATRRNLKLVKILDFDTKTERPTYKLMSSKQYLQEGLEMRAQKKLDRETTLKPEKLLSMSAKITEHDFQTKLKSILRLLSKKHQIRILITVDDNKEKAEAMFTQIQTAAKDWTRNVTKSLSGHNLKIHLVPKVEVQTAEDSHDKITVDEVVKAEA